MEEQSKKRKKREERDRNDEGKLEERSPTIWNNSLLACGNDSPRKSNFCHLLSYMGLMLGK